MTTEKLVRVSDVEYYLRQTARNMVDDIERKDKALSDEEKFQVVGCVFAMNTLADNAHRIPAANAVEVVRCKDCKHRGTVYNCPMRRVYFPPDGVGIYQDFTTDDGYCHHGEPKEVEA